MRKITISLFIGLIFSATVFSQTLSSVKGNVSDSYSTKPIEGVLVSILGTTINQLSDRNGDFILNNVPAGEQLVQIQIENFETQSFPVTIVEGETIDLGKILLYQAPIARSDLSVISLSDDELSNDEGGADNTAGLLQSSRDVFLSTAAYEFSSTFFRARGYNSENGKVLINGVEMNKMYNGRPQWSDWGGLNDVMRNQVLANGLAASEYTFGGIAGSNNISMRASEYREGGRISYASSNRSYTGRVMASYSSGLTKSGWAYSFLVSRRYANEGFNDGTLYDSNSFFTSIEKTINDKHSINFTAYYTPNRRGKSSPNTQEVYDLKNTRYNSYWGYQDGYKRNSRERHIEEPIFMLNHYWDINKKTSLNTNVAYQIGKITNSRLNYDANNPDPTYYRKLPSYFLRDAENPDYEGAYLAEQKFKKGGQIDWNAMYDANITNEKSVYALYDDRNDDTQTTVNTIFRTELTENIDLNASVSYRNLKSENYAHMKDLLGGDGYLDVDTFSDLGSDEAQNNLGDPNKIVQEGDVFKYNYIIDANIIDGFVQTQFRYDKVDFYVAGQLSTTNYQRNGLFENGRFLENRSLGKSEKLNFSNYGAKGGLTYKISGRHLIDVNVGYRTKAPTIRNSFSNSRENNDVVKNITEDSVEEKITTADLSYILRTPTIQARFTGYYTKFQDATEISFYYADGIYRASDASAFVQELLTGIEKRNIGLEVGISAQVTSTIKLKGALALGDYIYDSNPSLYLTSDDFDVVLEFGESELKNYHVAGGPQRAASVGFEYRDPDYWWFGATTNFFSNGYLDVSPLTRTSNFSTDIDGLPINGYDPELARELLAQEKFDNYNLVNVIGGKSWIVDDYYIGFFATISNVLNTKYKTGGYEQSRNANFTTLSEDKARDTPIFGPKYWYGYGASYYLNVYFRF